MKCHYFTSETDLTLPCLNLFVITCSVEKNLLKTASASEFMSSVENKKQEECSHKKHSVFSQRQRKEYFCRKVLIQAHPGVLLSCIAQDMVVAGHLKIRACLLLVLCLWQWTQQTLATPCHNGELRIIGKDEKKCCPKCSSSTGDNSTCQNTEDNDCKCRQGYSCSDKACLYCKKLPECAEGEELVKLGILDFTFKCKRCETGTYSNVKNGWCRNWTDCESSGFLTIKQGNSTHNAVCGFPGKDLEQAPITNDSLYTTILAILTAVAVFVLILLTFFLHFCIWSLKKEKIHAADDLEHNFPRLPVAPELSHHREETYSCQFPEEEHGDKTPEEKTCYFHPQNVL